MGPRAVTAYCVAVVIALAGCGGSSQKSSSGTTTNTTSSASNAATQSSALPAGTPAGLRSIDEPFLTTGELPGFVPRGHLALSTSAQSFVAELPPQERAPEVAKLKALGFVAAVSERLTGSTGLAGEEAVSLVEQYRSPDGASGQVTSQSKQALEHNASTFAVAGIPGARGFGAANDVDSNVAFSVGPYYYIVGVSAPSQSESRRVQLIAAAQSLYGRVRG